jgi:DNA-binding transcriptional LysR family regulator
MNDRFTAMQTYVRAVDGGSLSAAARDLGRSLAAVSRTISELEARLGVRLLHRSTRRLTATEAGLAYHAAARRILAEVEETEIGIGAAHTMPRGLLTVTAPLMFGRMHIAPVLNDYLARNAGVAAQLTLTDRNVRLVEEGVDVAVRIGWLADSSLVARPLGEIAQIVCAAPAYLKRRGTPANPDALKAHACIGVASLGAIREWTFRREGRDIRVPIAGQFTCNVVEPAIDAAIAGHGFVRVLSYQAAAALTSGTLVRVLQPFEPQPLPVSALYLSPRLLAARVRGFLDALSSAIPPQLAANARRAQRSRAKS